MAHFEKIFKFCQLPNKKFSAYDAKSVQDLLLKWGLKGDMSLDVFAYDAFFKDCDKDKFTMDFFKDQDVQAFFKISTKAKVWTFDGDLKSARLQVEIVPATVVNMEFFDKIFIDGLVRESGSICKCYDDQIGDILVSDELRKMLVSEESDFWDVFSDKERGEFIFKIFKHICIGGPVCQYEDEVGPYLDTAKFLYKDLVSVQKDKETKKLSVSSRVFKVTVLKDDEVVFPGSGSHEQSFAYFIIDPIKRHLTLWCHSWN